MKKLAFFLISAVVVACAIDSEPIPSVLGKWQVQNIKTTVLVNNVEVPLSFLGIDSIKHFIPIQTTIEFRTDGRYVLRKAGNPDVYGDWVLSRDEVRLILDRGKSYEQTFEIRQISQTTMQLFHKKEDKIASSGLSFEIETYYFLQKIDMP